MSSKKGKPGYIKIFTKKITLRNGRVIYAGECGLKAFCIWVKSK
ncbi:MAG: hypothetical protein NTX22_08210 [Ignavibacteriales bacterium]|nr:hypothetical protein [Ignavibacteriales bacterium]